MWYQIVSAIVNVGLAWQDQYFSNRINKKLYRAAAKTAEIKGQIEEANLSRRAAYGNEVLGQNVWNVGQVGRELLGKENLAMAASGFDTSTGDSRISYDTLSRTIEEQKGMNRTEYLQLYEDDLQVRSDILQYNFEAYANRRMAKHYSGISGLAKIIDAGGRAFVNSSPSMFAGKDKVSSNTGFGGFMNSGEASYRMGSSSPIGSKNDALGSYSNKLDLGYKANASSYMNF